MKAKTEQSPATSPNPIISVEKDGIVLCSNEAGEPLLREWGIEIGEKLPSTFRDLVQQVISRKSPEKLEVKVGNRAYLIVFDPVLNEEYVNISGFETSDQNEFAEKLQESERRYHLLFENMLDGFAYCKLLYDDCGHPIDFIYLDTNRAFEKLTGLKNVNGKRATEVFPGIKESHPELLEIYSRVASTGKPEKFGIEFKPLGIWLSISVYNTEKEHFVAVFDNITERKQAERALQESETKYRIIADNTSDWEFWLDTDGRFLYTSPSCELVTGYAAREFMDKPDLLQEIIHSDDRQAFLQHQHDMPSSRHGDIEFRIVTKDGEIRWIHHLCQSLYDGEGRHAGSRGSNRDITERKKAEETLAFERSQLLSIFDGIDDAVYVTDPYTYEVLYANKAMKEKFGGELVGGICYQKFQQKDSPCNFCSNLIILKEKDKPYQWEYYNPTVDRFFMIVDRIIKWPDGRDVRFEIAKDITERNRAEEALKKARDTLEEKVKERTAELQEAYNSLKESEKGLAEAQKMANIGNWEWNIATDKAYWSEEMYHIFGRNSQELAPPYNEFLNYVHPDDRDYVDSALKKAVKGKTLSIEYRIVWANGEEHAVHMQSEVIFDEINTPIRAKGIIQDITESKKTEEKIQTLANAVESSSDAIITVSLEGIITSWNRAAEQVYGYSAQEAIGKSVSTLAPSHLREETKKLNEIVIQGEKVHQYETLRLRKDDTIINVSLTLSPVFDITGKLVAISSIVRDVTERIKAEEALANLEIARKKEIHHRIKNNLQVISSLLDLQADKFDSPKVIEVFRESQNRVISMALIHEELHKGEGTDTLDFSAYLKELAENLFQTYRLSGKNIHLNTDLEENAFFNMDTAVPLGIIVNELVSNSLKHAFSGKDRGEIKIKLCREEGECKGEGNKSASFTLTVSDNGVGIPENLDIENLDSLGMQLVTSLVDHLDGEFDLNRNNGTEFSIRFTVQKNNN